MRSRSEMFWLKKNKQPNHKLVRMLGWGPAWICEQIDRWKLHALLLLSQTTSLERAFTEWHPLCIGLVVLEGEKVKITKSLLGTVNQVQFALSLTQPCYCASHRKGNWSGKRRPWATHSHQNGPQSNSFLTSSEYLCLFPFPPLHLLSIVFHKSEHISSHYRMSSINEIIIRGKIHLQYCTLQQVPMTTGHQFSGKQFLTVAGKLE